MARQLSLLENRRSWALSETTREVGRRGVADARAALEAALATARDDGATARVRRARSSAPSRGDRPRSPHGQAA